MDLQIQQEHISPDSNSSFHTLFNPRLSDLFYWHFHPEYELVYIEGANGTRHVGDHISEFKGCDLVLIGSNIPHLNFDYGIKTDYRKVVVHIDPSFVDLHLAKTPELADLSALFRTSRYGISFGGSVVKAIGHRMFDLEKCSSFEKYLELIKIFEHLATTDQYLLLHDRPYVNQYSFREQERMRQIYAFVDGNYHRKIALSEVADHVHLSREAFCRYFKKVSGTPFTHFLNRYRISQAKRSLMSGRRIGEACFSCGFESLSYFNRVFKRITGENPSDFKRRRTNATNA